MKLDDLSLIAMHIEDAEKHRESAQIELTRTRDSIKKAKALLQRYIANDRIASNPMTYELGARPNDTPPDTALDKAREAVRLAMIESYKPPTVEPVSTQVDEPLTINDEWTRVLDLLNNGTENLFITGEGGTGKSTLLRYYVDRAEHNVAIVAPTGIAALRVNGETIHHFFGWGGGIIDDDDIRRIEDKRRGKYTKLHTLIIDEISMVRADLMDAIDKFLRKNVQANKPFGGVRIVAFGDLFQLPPVIGDNPDERRYLKHHYGTEETFFFHAKCWRETQPKIVELTTIFRQKDPVFTGALNAVRQGIVTPEQLAIFNARVDQHFIPPVDELWMTLTTTNAAADKANQRMLAELPGLPTTFSATFDGDFIDKNGKPKFKEFPTDHELRLKPGASVMMIRNDNEHHRWVNGTMGKVLQVAPLMVEVKGLQCVVEPVTWEKLSYEFDEKTQKLTKVVIGRFTQVPIKLAAAITIHKAQGLSMDRAIIDLSSGTFASGQAYVGLSRLRDLNGLKLRRALTERDLIWSEEVKRFMRGEPITRPEPTEPAPATQETLL